MKMKFPLVLALASFLPLHALAADALAPIKNAVPLYEGFKAEPLAAALKMLEASTVSGSATPKDLVTFSGYDKTLFTAFTKVPAARTQSVEFTACTEPGLSPTYSRQITKGAAAPLDYAPDGFTDTERAAIEKADSRVLRYLFTPNASDPAAKGMTQYLDFNTSSQAHIVNLKATPLRIGTLKNPVQPAMALTRCTLLPVADAFFPDDILREAATADGSAPMEDKTGVRWLVKKGDEAGKWTVAGSGHLSAASAVTLFEKSLAARVKNGQQPWHVSQTTTLKGNTLVQRVQFAKFVLEGGRSEIMTLLVSNGKARLSWTITDTSLLVNASVDSPPPVPPNNPKKSFEAYIAPLSPAGKAALRLMQVSFECPDSLEAKSLDKDLISSRVLYETMGTSRLTSRQLRALSPADFQALVIAGVGKLKDIDETDVSTSANCSVAQSQLEEWSATLNEPNPDFSQFLELLDTLE